MVRSAFEEGGLDFLPLFQRIARRPPEKPVNPADAAAALAAADCVAAAAGRPPAEPSDALRRWLAAHPEAPTVPLMTAAIKALDRLRRDAAPPPERILDDLRTRLLGGGATSSRA